MTQCSEFDHSLVCQWLGARGGGLSAVSAKIALHEYQRRYPGHAVAIEPAPNYRGKLRVTVRGNNAPQP